MKFWRNAAALFTVFHPETTHTESHSNPKDVKNEGRPGYVDENKGTSDKMSEIISDICARLEPFLQKIGLSSSPNTSKVPRSSLYSRLPGGSRVAAVIPPCSLTGPYSILALHGGSGSAKPPQKRSHGIWSTHSQARCGPSQEASTT